MMRLTYSDPALADVEGILHYIGQDNPAAAVRFGKGILDTCQMLEMNPELGQSREDLAKHLRLFTYRGYGIYYCYTGNAVEIVRILHHALDEKRQSFD